jgi:hypothetical protein
LRNWQAARNGQSQYNAFRFAFAFNAFGTGPGVFPNDTLTSTVLTYQSSFNFINHTWDHSNLDAATAADIQSQLGQNNAYAAGRFTNFSIGNLVTPDVSGLYNATGLQAAYNMGIRYVVSDTSKPDQANPSPNTGIYNALVAGILELPRRPVNLYFNVTNPAEWLSEDNCLYPTGAYGHVATTTALRDRVSGDLLPYMLRGEMDPWMFHVANFRAYDGSHSLMTDLMDSVFSQYTATFNLPVLSPKMDELGSRFAARMAYNASGVTASRTGNSVTITAKRTAMIPVTGLKISGSESYGGQYIAHVLVIGGRSATYTML